MFSARSRKGFAKGTRSLQSLRSFSSFIWLELVVVLVAQLCSAVTSRTSACLLSCSSPSPGVGLEFHLTLCSPLLLLPFALPIIRVFPWLELVVMKFSFVIFQASSTLVEKFPLQMWRSQLRIWSQGKRVPTQWEYHMQTPPRHRKGCYRNRRGSQYEETKPAQLLPLEGGRWPMARP